SCCAQHRCLPLQRFNTLTIETRSLPTLARYYPRSFTFYVAHPIRSIQRFNDSRGEWSDLGQATWPVKPPGTRLSAAGAAEIQSHRSLFVRCEIERKNAPG